MKTSSNQSSLFQTILLLVFLLLPQLSFSQDETPEKRPPFDSITTVFQYLQNYDEIIIETELDSLVQNKYRGKKQRSYVTIAGKNQTPIRIELSIEPRGVFRRRTCEIPPIKLDFIKSDLKERGLYQKYDDLKLVTTCIDEPDRDQILQKEFWTYKMYNQLSPESFQVHPLKLSYVDLNDSTRVIQMRAFLIENTDEMAHRLNGEIVEERGTVDSMLEATAYGRTLMFNYMIGNTDWNIKMVRNVKLVRIEGSKKLTVVPYDFDFTALVHPSYFKIVSTENPTENMNNRVALGSFSNAAALRSLSQQFLQQKDTGFHCYQVCSVLEEQNKERMEDYLSPFFKLLSKERRLKRVFLTSK